MTEARSKALQSTALYGIAAVLAVVQAFALLELGEAALTKATVAFAQALSLGAGRHEAPTDGAPREPRNSESEASTIVAKLTPPSPVTPRLPPPPDDFDPLGAPACEGITALIVTEFADSSDSIAVLQDQRGARPRRIGDTLGRRRVAFIGYNPRETSPAVWLADGEKLCQVALFRPPVKEAAPAVRIDATAPNAGASIAPSGEPSELVAAVTRGIRRVSDTEFELERSALELMLENQHVLMKGARLVPLLKDGKVMGPRLFGVRPGTMLNAIGLRSGDGIESINGYKLSTPEEGLQAYGRLRTAKTLSLKVDRPGGHVTLTYRIQ